MKENQNDKTDKNEGTKVRKKERKIERFGKGRNCNKEN